MRKSFICGNWKMNTTPSEGEVFVRNLQQENWRDVDVLIAPPFTSIDRIGRILDSRIFLGAQNISEYDDGAYTGEISASMLKDLHVTYVLVGHSERRNIFGEDDGTVRNKVKKALEKGLRVILCVGEEEQTRKEGKHEAFVAHQVQEALKGLEFEDVDLTIAYEPVWAIGTGNTCAAEDAQNMCRHIRNTVEELKGSELAEKIRILYGGSVKPSNISELMDQEDIDGALVGGASLKVDDFVKIINYEV